MTMEGYDVYTRIQNVSHTVLQHCTEVVLMGGTKSTSLTLTMLDVGIIRGTVLSVSGACVIQTDAMEIHWKQWPTSKTQGITQKH